MIANVTTGGAFKTLVSYLETGEDGLQDPRERVAWVECRNLPTRDAQTAACIMAATASLSVSGAKECVYHLTISCDPGDPVDGEALRRIADRTIRDLGQEEYQALIFAHADRAHPHLHIVVNRVHPERHTLWRMWRDYPRIERSLRRQEQELGLRIVPGWNSAVVRTADGGLRVPEEHETGVKRVLPRPSPRRGDAEFLREVTARAAPVMEQAQSWSDVERGLAEAGLTLRAKGGGFIITDGKRQVKASEVGRECSRHFLEKRFGRWPDYRARMAVAGIETAARTPDARRDKSPRFEEAAPAQQQEAAAQEQPVAHASPIPRTADRVPVRRRPQFGDAGHGIAELFASTPSPAFERPAPVPERASDQLDREENEETPAVELPASEQRRDPVPAPALPSPDDATPAPQPQPKRKPVTFRKQVQERAGLVLERAESWAELERGLADIGLSLREKGGGFVVTDGEREVKASEVGRAFSRFHLEKRLGRWPGSRPIAPEVDPAAEPQAERVAHKPEGVLSAPPVPTAPAPSPMPEPRGLQADAPATRRVQADVPVLAPAEQQVDPVEVKPDYVPTASEPEVETGATPSGRERDVRTVEPPSVADAPGSAEHIHRDPVEPAGLTEPAGRAPKVSPDEMTPLVQVERSEEVQPAVSPGLPVTPEPSVSSPAPVEAPRRRAPEPKRFSLYESFGTFGVHDNATGDIYLVGGRDRAMVELKTANRLADLYPNANATDYLQALDDAWNDARGFDREDRTASRVAPERAVDPPPVQRTAHSPEPSAPVREKPRPLTARENYQATLRGFTRELALLYRDPRAARRAFVASLTEIGARAAVHALESDPERFGRLRLWAERGRTADVAAWGKLYADWQLERTRPDARRAATLFRRAREVADADAELTEARAALDRLFDAARRLADRVRAADEGEQRVKRCLREIYDEPVGAQHQIALYRNVHGRAAMQEALRTAPEKFGRLASRERRMLVLRDTRGARWRAQDDAKALGDAFDAMDRRPTHDERTRAEQAVSTAEKVVRYARTAREKLGPESVKELVHQGLLALQWAGRGSADRTRMLYRQARPMLPASTLQFVRTLQDEINRDQEREYAREQSRSRGAHDFW